MTTARPAFALGYSIGVNIHLDQPAYAPGGTYLALQGALAALWPNGKGNLRLSSAPVIADASGKQALFINALAADFYSFLLTPNINDPPNATQEFFNLCPNAFATVEGLNEPDVNGITTAETLAFQKQIDQNAYAPVIGPSITKLSYATEMGDLADYIDSAGNVHFYTSGHPPENLGYGDGGYGSLVYTLAIGRATAPTKSIWVTECGFAGPAASAASYGPLDENTRAAYILRALLYLFMCGVQRTYLYELVTSNAVEQYGLISALDPFTPTPSFYALQGFMALMADTAHYDEPNLPITIQAPTGIASLLLHKANGSVVIVLWNVSAGLAPNQTVTVVASGYQNVGKGSWFWNGAWHSDAVVFFDGLATMGVGGAPFFLELVT